jgi:hypothetical protein
MNRALRYTLAFVGLAASAILSFAQTSSSNSVTIITGHLIAQDLLARGLLNPPSPISPEVAAAVLEAAIRPSVLKQVATDGSILGDNPKGSLNTDLNVAGNMLGIDLSWVFKIGAVDGDIWLSYTVKAGVLISYSTEYDINTTRSANLINGNANRSNTGLQVQSDTTGGSNGNRYEQIVCFYDVVWGQMEDDGAYHCYCDRFYYTINVLLPGGGSGKAAN